jgi:phytoene dehydrogenase-like protein
LRIPKNSSYDAVIIGAGHNGLTAAAYLAGAGLSTLILERREIVGGCCVTEEIAPGCRASTTSYIASMLRPEVIRDLELPSFGLRMVPCDPFLQVPFSDGRIIRWWANRERAAEEIRGFSVLDARTFLAWTLSSRNLRATCSHFFWSRRRSWALLAGKGFWSYFVWEKGFAESLRKRSASWYRS